MSHGFLTMSARGLMLPLVTVALLIPVPVMAHGGADAEDAGHALATAVTHLLEAPDAALQAMRQAPAVHESRLPPSWGPTEVRGWRSPLVLRSALAGMHQAKSPEACARAAAVFYFEVVAILRAQRLAHAPAADRSHSLARMFLQESVGEAARFFAPTTESLDREAAVLRQDPRLESAVRVWATLTQQTRSALALPPIAMKIPAATTPNTCLR